MAIEKRENVFLSLTIQATPIVNDKAEIEYVLNNTLQTGSCYVDTETNNLIGAVTPNPAYQQPDDVVQQYLGDAMASLVSSIEHEKNTAKAAAEEHAAALAVKDAALTASQAQATEQLTERQAAHEQAMTAAKTAHEAEVKTLKASVTSLQATVAEKDMAIAAKDTLNAKLYSALGGTDEGQRILKEDRLKEIESEKAEASAKRAQLEAEEAELKGA